MGLVNLDLMHAELLRVLLEFRPKPYFGQPVSCPTAQAPTKITKNSNIYSTKCPTTSSASSWPWAGSNSSCATSEGMHMTHPAPERRERDLSRIWQSLTTDERVSWLRTARAIVHERFPDPVLWLMLAHLCAALVILMR